MKLFYARAYSMGILTICTGLPEYCILVTINEKVLGTFGIFPSFRLSIRESSSDILTQFT